MSVHNDALETPHAASGRTTTDGTSSAVPEDLRAYSRAALQIDEQIHELALRLRGVLEAYRATNPEFGGPVPHVEDDLERYAQRCREVDLWVGRVADAFERAGTAAAPAARPTEVTALPAPQPVTVADAALESALGELRRATQPPPPPATPTPKHHDDGGLFGFLGGIKDDVVHAVEHPLDTVEGVAGAAASAGADFVEGFASGMKDMATAAYMLSRVAPLTPTWCFSMAVDPESTVRLQRKFAQGLLHMAEDPVGTLGNMVDAKDLARGDVFRWAGHLAPDVILALATAGAASGADAVAGATEGASEEILELGAADSWGSPATLGDHFLRHGPELGATSAEDYATRASRFFERSQRERMPTRMDASGVVRTYDPTTNEFGAFAPDGRTKTYFAPDPAVHGYGSNRDYWLAQPGFEPWTP